MTYERMIEIISRKSAIPDAGESFDEINEAYDMAIDCLAELQAYRECPLLQDECYFCNANKCRNGGQQ